MAIVTTALCSGKKTLYLPNDVPFWHTVFQRATQQKKKLQSSVSQVK